MKKWHISVRTKIIVTSLLLILVPCLMIGAFNYMQATKELDALGENLPFNHRFTAHRDTSIAVFFVY